MDTLGLILPVFDNIFGYISALDAEFLFLSPAISLFTIFTVWRFLLAPFLGGSDTVNQRKQRNSNSKQEYYIFL